MGTAWGRGPGARGRNARRTFAGSARFRVGICLAAFAAVAGAQTFDVATVKATPSGTREFRLGAQHGTLTGRNITLAQYIAFAYDVLPAQIAGAPAWVKQETFDIIGKGAVSASDEDVQKMLQALLEKRFGLKLHRESKEMPVYVLTVAKGGPKMHEAKESSGGFRLGRGKVQGDGVTMGNFAGILSGRVDRPVVDGTGLTGSYDFELQWTPQAAPASPNPDEASPDPSGPSIFTAVQEQLGLRLEARRAPVPLLVLDHVERAPTPN